jgi:adenylyl-sulfate kinase
LSPLTGFMTRQAYESVLSNTALPDGLPWGLPVTLALDHESASSVRTGYEVALYHGSDAVGVMRVDELFSWDPDREASALYGTEKIQHPQIAERLARKAVYLAGGPFVLLAARGSGFIQRKHLWPLELRSQILQHEWKQVAVPHVCYPWRRTHEYLLKCALEYSDALLLHDSIEQISSSQAIPADLVMTASRMLIEGYFPADRMLTNPVPVALCAQHPRAVLQHAILSQNCGASLFFVPETGMSPAGMVDLRTFFSEGVRDWLAIRPVFMPGAFHCDPCGGIATGKSCPHDDGQRVDISDSEIADRLSVGEALPPQVTRPEIARAMARAMSERVANTTVRSGGRHIYPHVSEVSRDLRQSIAGHKACALWMTGLSGSGKSTIAHRLERELLLSGHRVFVVDGDTLRNGLNRDLGFGEDDRRENLRRAAEVVKVMVEAGMIVIASFISPFRAERQMVREILGASFREVYVEASLEACEQRDPKGLYKRARAGQIPQFTGISSPYESPDNPDVRLDTAVCSVEECVRRLRDDLVANGTLRASRDDSRAAGIAALARNSIHIQ